MFSRRTKLCRGHSTCIFSAIIGRGKAERLEVALPGGSHFNLPINDSRDDLLEIHDDKKKGRTLKRWFEKFISKIWNVFQKYHINKEDFIFIAQ